MMMVGEGQEEFDDGSVDVASEAGCDRVPF